MKFLDSLYTIASECSTAAGYGYVIHLNPEHFIYAAHFPGEPVTPGVCILQIAVELLSRCMNRTLEVRNVRNVKFLKVLVPQEGLEVSVHIGKIEMEGDMVKSQIVVSTGEDTVAKISIVCQIVR